MSAVKRHSHRVRLGLAAAKRNPNLKFSLTKIKSVKEKEDKKKVANEGDH